MASRPRVPHPDLADVKPRHVDVHNQAPFRPGTPARQCTAILNFAHRLKKWPNFNLGSLLSNERLSEVGRQDGFNLPFFFLTDDS